MYLYINVCVCVCYRKRNTDNLNDDINDDDEELEEELEVVLMSEYEKARKQRIAENKRKFDEYWKNKCNQPPFAGVTKKRKVDANKVCDFLLV